MTDQERRSGPVSTRAASTSIRATVTDVDTVPPSAVVLETLRALVDGLRAPRRARPSCPCGCTSRDGAPDPDCLRFVSDHGVRYREKIARQRAIECRSLDDIAPGLMLCLGDGTPVAEAAELFGVTVEQARAVLDLLPPDDPVLERTA